MAVQSFQQALRIAVRRDIIAPDGFAFQGRSRAGLAGNGLIVQLYLDEGALTPAGCALAAGICP